LEALLERLAVLKDPRAANASHPYPGLLLGIVWALAAGCVGPEAIAGFITDRFDELGRWTTMGRQPPCPRTIQRVLKGTGAAAGALLDLVGPLPDRDILALDGKVVRGASKRRHHVHVVTAWSTPRQRSVATSVVDHKGREPQALLDLIARTARPGVTITIDANGAKRGLAKAIIDQGAGYILALKNNNKTTIRAVAAAFGEASDPEVFEETDKGHGRVEIRRATVLPASGLTGFRPWPGLTAVGRIERVREELGKGKDGGIRRTVEICYHLLSERTSAQDYAGRARGHWGIENKLHGVLDTTMDEDHCQLQGAAAVALSLLRRFTLSLIRTPPGFRSIAQTMRHLARNVDAFIRMIALMEVT